jgi:hypothetical protein
MKRYLILFALLACAVCWAGKVTGSASRPQPVPAPVPVPVISPGSASDVRPASGAPRHLSEAERAELRRQLDEFNRRYGKHS